MIETTTEMNVMILDLCVEDVVVEEVAHVTTTETTKEKKEMILDLCVEDVVAEEVAHVTTTETTTEMNVMILDLCVVAVEVEEEAPDPMKTASVEKMTTRKKPRVLGET